MAERTVVTNHLGETVEVLSSVKEGRAYLALTDVGSDCMMVTLDPDELRTVAAALLEIAERGRTVAGAFAKLDEVPFEEA